MTFIPYTLYNNISSKVVSHANESGTITLKSGDGAKFGNPSSEAPIRVTLITALSFRTLTEISTIFSCTGRSGDTLTGITAIEGTTDQTFAANDYVQMRLTAGAIQDIHNVINTILNPFAAPDFSSFSINSQSTTLEVGTGISSGSVTFLWTTDNSENVTSDSISITDTTTSTSLATALPNTGSASVSIIAITNTSPTTHVWTILGTDTQSDTFTKTFSVVWEWRVFAGTSANVTLTSGQIQALSDFSSLSTTALRTYNLSAGNYKYVCFPDSFATPSTWMSSGFGVALATSSDNAAYSNTDTSGNQYAIVSITNAHSQTTNYRVYRSQNTLGGSLNLEVS